MVAAVRMGSTCRPAKPAMAPSTAVFRSVHAIATAPGVASGLLATGGEPFDQGEVAGQLRLAESRVAPAPVVVRQARDPVVRHSAGQQAGGHRRVDDDAHPFALRERKDLLLCVAVDKGILRLQCLDRRDRLDAAQLPGIEVRDADVPHQAAVRPSRQALPVSLLCRVPSTITAGRGAVVTASRQYGYRLARNPGLRIGGDMAFLRGRPRPCSRRRRRTGGARRGVPRELYAWP